MNIPSAGERIQRSLAHTGRVWQLVMATAPAPRAPLHCAGSGCAPSVLEGRRGAPRLAFADAAASTKLALPPLFLPERPPPSLFLLARPLAPAPRPLAPTEQKCSFCCCLASCYVGCARNVLFIGLILAAALSIDHKILDIPKGGD